MQKLSETAAFVRLMEISRAHLLQTNHAQHAEARERDDGLFACEIAAEKQINSAVKALEGTEHASNDKQRGDEVGLHGGSSNWRKSEGLANRIPVDGRVQFFRGDAGSNGDQRALAKGDVATREPVLNVLAANCTAKPRHQSRGAAAHSDGAANPVVGEAGVAKLRVCKTIGPSAYFLVVQAEKPLVLVAACGLLHALLDERSFASDRQRNQFGEVVLKKFYAQAAHTIGVAVYPGFRVDGATNLDVAIAEMADVERFHLGRLDFGDEKFGEMLASQGGENAVRDAIGQHVGPLSHSRGGDSDSFGGGCDRAPKQFDGASFKHDGAKVSTLTATPQVRLPLAGF